jgi:hypothetical protein
MAKRLTIGALRKVIKNLPDDAPIYPTWASRIPDDYEPGVEIKAIEAAQACLHIKVDLFYLNEGE